MSVRHPVDHETNHFLCLICGEKICADWLVCVIIGMQLLGSVCIEVNATIWLEIRWQFPLQKPIYHVRDLFVSHMVNRHTPKSIRVSFCIRFRLPA